MTRIRNVDRFKAKDYLKRAEECIHTMNAAFDRGEFNACVINAVHAAIAAADALCIFTTGIRHAGQRHEDALTIFRDIDPRDEDIKRNLDHLKELLQIKSVAEYGEELMDRKRAELYRKHAERLFAYVKSRIESA